MAIFEKKSIGVDISDSTIEIVEIIKNGTRVVISSLSRVFIDPGMVENGVIKDEKRLAEFFNDAVKKGKPKKITPRKINFALPESQVYTHIFNAKVSLGDKLEKIVAEEAKNNIPINADDLIFKYNVIHRDLGKMDIMVYGVSRQIMLSWQSFFKKVGAEVDSFDTESSAIFRGLFNKFLKNPIAIVDIGAKATKIYVFNRGALIYSHSMALAGKAITENIATALGLKKEEAETEKISQGLDNENKKLYEAIAGTLETITNEVLGVLVFLEKKNGVKPEKIIAVGGSSQMNGLLEFLSEKLKLPAELGQPEFLNKQAPFEYLGAIGLAMKEFSTKILKEEFYFTANDKTVNRILGGGQAEKPGGTVEILAEPTENTKTQKHKNTKTLLILFLILTIALLSALVVYLVYDQKQKQAELQSIITNYKLVQSFDLQIPIAVNENEYSIDRVKGRMIQNKVETAGSRDEGITHARLLAEKELKSGEDLWPIPVAVRGPAKGFDFPMSATWIIYSKNDIIKLYTEAIDGLNVNKVNYALNNIKKENLTLTDNKNVYLLGAQISVSLNEYIIQ